MADDRHDALKDYGWTQDEGDDQWISARHTDLVVILGDGAGWQARQITAVEGQAMVMVIGHSRYGTRLADWLHRLEEPQPAREA